MNLLRFWVSFAIAINLLAIQNSSAAPSLILADTDLLLEVGVPIVDHAPEIGVALAELDPLDEDRLIAAAHARGKCGGFQRLSTQPWQDLAEQRELARESLDQLVEVTLAPPVTPAPELTPVQFDPAIQAAVNQVDEGKLRETVTFLSGFETRFHRSPTPNRHIDPMIQKIQEILSQARWISQVDTFTHTYTQQKSIRVRIPGATQPDEIVVMGAHLDSINQGWSSSIAPGADDNASGSANILEALRILAAQPRPARTIDLFWYAGEEGGLIGSSEIAKAYARAGNKVVGALQLDMTLFPGDGEFTLGSMTDFTSPELRQWFVELNRVYIGGKIIEDRCGYGCSDHASWHSSGYRALMPFEASFDRMFADLHTTKDVISDKLSFRHSAMFSKIAVAFAMTLGSRP
jgi:leucyl aminopeptidase